MGEEVVRISVAQAHEQEPLRLLLLWILLLLLLSYPYVQDPPFSIYLILFLQATRAQQVTRVKRKGSCLMSTLTPHTRTLRSRR